MLSGVTWSTNKTVLRRADFGCRPVDISFDGGESGFGGELLAAMVTICGLPIVMVVVFGNEKRTAMSVTMSEFVFMVVSASATVLRSGGSENRFILGVLLASMVDGSS